MRARDIMTTTSLQCCRQDTTLQEASAIMADHDVGSLPVCDSSDRLEGIVTDRDICCRGLAKGLGPDSQVSQVMSTDLRTAQSDWDLDEVETVMSQYRIRRLPVVDNENRLVGFISTADLLRHIEGRQQEHEVIEVLEEISAP